MGRRLPLLAISLLVGCTTVRVVQRDECWVRQTERFGALKEDLGPCRAATPHWSPDRLTRLVQECAARADYRWHGDALAAWNRGERLPAPQNERTVLDACLAEATQVTSLENDLLQTRVDDLLAQRERTQTHNEHLADVLGEAAKKPAGTATATASAQGDSSSRNDSTSDSQHASETTAPVAAPAAAPMVFHLDHPPAPADDRPLVVVRQVDDPALVACAEPEPAPKPVKRAAPRKVAKKPAPPPAAEECVCPGPTAVNANRPET